MANNFKITRVSAIARLPFQETSENTVFLNTHSVSAFLLLDSFRRSQFSGVALEGAPKQRFNALSEELSRLSRTFAQNVLDATRALVFTHTERAAVAGLPPTVLRQGAAAAAQSGRHPGATAEAGPWQFTLDPATYQALLTYTDSREWRRRYFEAMQRRAAPVDARGRPLSDAELVAHDFSATGTETGNAADGAATEAEAEASAPLDFSGDRATVAPAAPAAPATPASADNGVLLHRILAARTELARSLLGMPDYAHASCAAKMSATPAAALQMLERMRAVAAERARDEMAALTAFAHANGFGATTSTDGLSSSSSSSSLPSSSSAASPPAALAGWDVPYWAERQRQALFAFSAEELRAYFPLPRVLDGLFELLRRLFGVTVARASPADLGGAAVPVWSPDVGVFAVREEATGEVLAYFYLDAYARPANKRGGAWMGTCVSRREAAAASAAVAQTGSSDESSVRVRLPVAHIVCNQTPPQPSVDGGICGAAPTPTPSLMTFREVETLFHEMGHALQHMLTAQTGGAVAGIAGVEWDAVELPSQFMENFLYDRDVLRLVSAHVHSGASVPDALLRRLRDAKNHHAALALLRQLHLAVTDLRLHCAADLAAHPNAFALERAQAAATTVDPRMSDARFLCGFSHIFAGGYAAGYYSYKWAEILSADAFGAFDEAAIDAASAGAGGGDGVAGTASASASAPVHAADADSVADAAAAAHKWASWARIGRRFRATVLALGGAVAPAEVFARFRGRAPTPDALLRASGLSSASPQAQVTSVKEM
jgi:oligopeptidase A